MFLPHVPYPELRDIQFVVASFKDGHKLSPI